VTGKPPRALRDAAVTASWALAIYAGSFALGEVLGAKMVLRRLVVQVVGVEWAARRLGVSWSDPSAEEPLLGVGAVLRRSLVGLSLGALAAALVLAFARATMGIRSVSLAFVPSDVALGLVIAAMSAVKDELLLRGTVLRSFRGILGEEWQLVLAGLVAIAARVGQAPDVPAMALFQSAAGCASLASAGLFGAAMAALWQRERGAYVACAVHAGWTFATTTAITGGLASATWGATTWGGGGFEGSLASAVGVLALTVAVLVWRRRS
jgi:hypothetical protein